MHERSISVESLVIQRGNFKLGPLSFEIGPAQPMVLIGKNGAGKTSLLRCLNGRLQPTEGQLRIGKEVQKSCALGVENIFFGHWSIRKNFDWLAQLGSLKVRNPKVLKHIDEFFEQKVMELSSGKRRQAELVFALAYDFDLYLMDEAFSHLDPEQKEFFKNEINELIHEKKILMMSGHDLGEFEGLRISLDLRL